jgi:hypothetical protein
MMFLATLRLLVIAKDAECDIERSITLGIPPFPGLILRLDGDNHVTIETIIYDFDNNIFELRCRDYRVCFSCSCGPKDNCCVLKVHLPQLLKEGWEIEPGSLRVGDRRLFKKRWSFADGDCQPVEFDGSAEVPDV